MDFNKADRLLEKYFAGDTSLGEEKRLQEYFNREEDVPPDQAYAAGLFRYFRQEATLEYKEPARSATRFGRVSLLKVAGVAAAALILIGALFFLQKPDEPVAYAYINGLAITDREMAIEETQKALALISEKFNQSTADLSYLSKITDIKEKFTKDK